MRVILLNDLRQKGKRSVPAAEAVGITGPLRGGKGPREPRPEGAPERDRGFDRERGYDRDRGDMSHA